MEEIKDQEITEQEIEERVRQLLFENMIEGSNGGYTFHYTKPSPDTYPFQYFWDTCFHVNTLTSLGEHEMAKKHIRSLFLLQDEDGFVGHILYWKHPFPARITDIFQLRPKDLLRLHKPHSSALIQPPLVAQAVERIYQRTHDKAFLEEMLPKLKRYYKWLMQNRDFEQEGLLSIITPYESGMDWKASYDPVLNYSRGKAGKMLFLKVMWLEMGNFRRGYDLKKIYAQDNFIVKDVAFNTLYALNLLALADLCAEAGDTEQQFFRDKAQQCSASILKYMYNAEDQAFYDLAGHSMRQLKVATATVFFPVALPNIPDAVCKAVLERHLFHKDGFRVPYPVPSLSVHEPAFDPGESVYIWRGPTWVMFNWFMHRFLLDKGYTQEAAELLRSVKELIAKSGFREYYNPFTGEGLGAHSFTWSGLVLDMMQAQNGASAN
ncbi:trehalase-like protein [Pontibacter sp. E15-1]|uniref:amylo-alpha-1,6-glucosidase n=1 Tax=Pontibacter sp. E15-1 TaxID=2919918 RepID=UPI001F5020AA|nr:trehalase family glycosidase [Pontibacter sp. E15-1]MCJ8166750.1 trehalase-like protein [Pontibacter sp. E15-1]